MSKGKLIGIIVGVVCIIIVVIVVVTGVPRPDAGSDGEAPHGNSDGKIAFQQTDGIHIIDPDGTNEFRLIEGDESVWPLFVWSPDGQKVAYGVEGELCIVNADGTGRMTIRSFENGTPYPLHWSANGQILLNLGGNVVGSCKCKGGSVYTVNGDGTNLVKLGDMQSGVDVGACALSLDGRKVVCTEKGPDGGQNYYVWIMNTDGSGRRKLVEDSLYLNPFHYDELTWSPDGNRITFRQMADRGGLGRGLWLIDADGTNKVQLGGDCAVGGWSPDGKKLAICDYESGLFIVNLENMSRTKVSTHTDCLPVSWSPNGDRIVFFIDDGSLVVANTDGSGSSVIGYGYRPQWSPG